MGLRSNYLGSLRIIGGQAYTSMFVLNPRRALFNDNTKIFGKYASIPSGYQSVAKAWIPSRADSSVIKAIVTGESSFLPSIVNVVTLLASLQGVGNLLLNAEQGISLISTLTGQSNLSAYAYLIASLQASIDAGARPSAFDIAQEVWQAKQVSYTDPTSMGYILANQDPAALADLIMNDPRFLSVAIFLGLK